ncbi:HYR domain-containing protein [Luteibaculum oceani]|uniref:Gliding motility-associated C-terminal domain-containing protein n=1 Tax=Luteibaculum oceani TaxID=1294296 RepID=A0A5C6UWF5_9FLAO|nr:HYR domain-containing protein [Luteibaculum oceani]TXC76994.1 gliding motility-associated C-terminal domain-containing protein [Luteibaculum oceani]
MRKSLLLLLGLTTWCVSAFSNNYVLSKNHSLDATEQTQTNQSIVKNGNSVFAKFLRNELVMANNVQQCDGAKFFNAASGTCENTQITWNIPFSGDGEALEAGYPRVVDLSTNAVLPVNPNTQPITLPVGRYEIQYVFEVDDVCIIPVTVRDRQAPLYDPNTGCNEIYALTTDPNECFATLPANTVQIPTGSDNCQAQSKPKVIWSVVDLFDGVITDTVLADAAGFLPDTIQFGEGINVVSFVLVDSTGNAVPCTAEVTVTDDNVPVFVDNAGTPVDTSDFGYSTLLLETDSAFCYAIADIDLPNGIDTCFGNLDVFYTIFDDAGDTLDFGIGDISNFQFPKGTSTILVETTDGIFFLRFAFDVVVTDFQGPILSDCISDFAVDFHTSNNGAGDCLAEVTFNEFTATDNCPGAISKSWFILDKDTTAPILAGNTFPVVATLEPDTFVLAFGAEDADGNLSELCFARFAVLDDETPQIVSAPTGNQNLVVDANCEADYTITVPNISDNSTGCAGPGIMGGFFAYYTITNVSGGDTIKMDTVAPGTLNVTETFGLGDFIVTWSAEDFSGNASLIESYQVTVEDDIDPTINAAVFSGSTDTTIMMSSYTSAFVNNGCGIRFTIPAVTVDDNCSIASVTASSGSLDGTYALTDTLVKGVNSFEYTVVDGSGNEASATVNITVVDDIAPKLNGDFAYPNINEPAPLGKCSFTKSWKILNFFKPTDNCAGELDSLYVVVTYDMSGAATIDTLVQNKIANIGSQQAISVTFPGPNKQHLVEVYATDKSGNSVSKSFQVSTIDDQAPVISFQDTLRVFVNSVNCTSGRDTVIITNDLVSDNCTDDATLIANMTNSVTPALGDTLYLDFTIDPNPFHPVSITTADEVGNVFTKNFIVHIVDTLLPGVDLTPLDTVVNDFNLCVGTTKVFAPVGTDACGIKSIEYNINNAGFVTLGNGVTDFDFTFPQGSNDIVWQVTDSNDNVSIDTQKVVVIDAEAPMIDAIADIDLVTNPGECGRMITVPFPTVTDNCQLDSAYFTFSDNNGNDTILANSTDLMMTIEPGFVYTGMVYAVDVFGNVDSTSFDVMLRDVEAPSITCPQGSITIQANTPDCEAVVTLTDEFDFNPSDNCGDFALIGFDGINFFDPSMDHTFPVGITNVKVYIADAFGNVDSCTFNTVVENNIESHIFDFPTDTVLLTTANECSKRYFWSEPRIIGGTCNGETIEVSKDFNSGDQFPIDTTVVTYTFVRKDGAGTTLETYTRSFSIVVQDKQAPVMTQVPADRTLQVGADCLAELQYSDIDYQDNCDAQGLVVTIADSLRSGSKLGVGVYEVEITVTDKSGNSVTESFTVTVVDNRAPVVTVPTEVVNVCGTNFNPASYATATDNCGISSFTVTPAATAGLNTYTATAVDVNNNTTVKTFQINAIENNTAVITGAPTEEVCEGYVANLVGTTPGAGQTGMWTSAAGNVVIDNPSSPSTAVTFNNPGTYVVTYTLDNSGACPNSSASVTVVVLEDVQAEVDAPTLSATNGEVTLNGNDAPGVDNGTWSTTNTTANILDVNDPNSRVININSQTEFTWTIDILGCTPSSATVTVLVPALRVETGFTPGAATNQYWDLSNVTSNDDYANGTVTVFNRWGSKVFESTISEYNGNGRWDGTFEGSDLPTASYYFVIDPNKDGVEVLTGHVTIIR